MRITLAATLAALPLVASLPSCGPHGSFSVWHGALGCFCEPGWSGRDCTTPVCSPECLGGRCVAPGVCECSNGWVGAACDERPCPLGCGGQAGDLEVKVLYTPGKGKC